MTRKKRMAINSLAESVRNACELTLPTDVELAVKRLGGEVVEGENLDFEAQIEKTISGFRITLAQEFDKKRKMFSIAHELGHLFLHMGYIINEKKWDSISVYSDSVYNRYGHSIEEYEANEFAAAFLMPNKEFQSVCSSFFDSNKYDIDFIADTFGVSRDAASTRGKWLGIFSW